LRCCPCFSDSALLIAKRATGPQATLAKPRDRVAIASGFKYYLEYLSFYLILPFYSRVSWLTVPSYDRETKLSPLNLFLIMGEG
jgi:hypothetical protein